MCGVGACAGAITGAGGGECASVAGGMQTRVESKSPPRHGDCEGMGRSSSPALYIYITLFMPLAVKAQYRALPLRPLSPSAVASSSTAPAPSQEPSQQRHTYRPLHPLPVPPPHPQTTKDHRNPGALLSVATKGIQLHEHRLIVSIPRLGDVLATGPPPVPQQELLRDGEVRGLGPMLLAKPRVLYGRFFGQPLVSFWNPVASVVRAA